MYYIYHIPGKKIGCTSHLKQRMEQQGFTEWEILETHDDGWCAGDREKELQAEYGYPIDKVHYMIARQNMQKAQRVANNGWQTGDQAARGRKNKGRIRKDLSKINKDTKRSLTFEQAEEIRSKWIPKTYGLRKLLAQEYNVNPTIIHNIVNNQAYLEP